MNLTSIHKIAIILIACLLGHAAPLQAQSSGALPTLGDASDMGSGAERRLGDRIAREIYRDPDYLDDPLLVDYVQGVWQPLLAAARLRGDLSPELDERFAWEVLLGRDRTVNAFALPGGYFGVHLGLLAVVGNRDELASVLGHELSHVTQRHISRLMSKQSQQTPWMIGAMILGAMAASKNPDAGNALIVGGQAVAAQNQLNFSRDMEREADRIGFGVMTQAGFQAQGFVSMFDKLQQATRLSDNGAYPYLRSHPLTSERIADMQSRQLLNPAPAPNPEPTIEHALMAVRARVLANADVDSLRATLAQASSANVRGALTQSRQAALWYGAALAASRLRQITQATDYANRLQVLLHADATGTRLARLLAAEVALAAGNAPLAAKSLVTDAVVWRPSLLLGAHIATQTGDPAALAYTGQRLQSWVIEHPRDAQAWQLLSGVYAAQGHKVRSIRAGAEVQVVQFNYAAALDRFKAAQDLTRQQPVSAGPDGAADYIEASIIDTRQRQVAELLREQTLDR